MPGLYDSYQLANSRTIPQYQGSAVPELQKVADVFQNRYDVGQQQADLIDQTAKTATAHPVDQPLLSSLKNEYRQKLKGYTDAGNYEDTWRNVAMDTRDFTGKVKTIASNQQAIQGWAADMQKRVQEGKLDPAVAQARQLQMMDTYKGLQVDPETGQYTNHFVGSGSVPSIDIPEKINKWLSESHAIERGWKAEKDVNGWYITNGTETKRLPWGKIKPVIDAGMALDPEVKAYLQQEHELAPYYQGVTRKIPTGQIDAVMHSSPILAQAIQAKMNLGMDKVSALHAVLGDQHVTNRINEIYDYARKGVVDVQKGEYGEKMDPLLEDRLKKQQDRQPMLFTAPYSDVGPGQNVKSLQDFNDIQTQAANDKNTLMGQLADFKNNPNIIEDKQGNLLRREPDGTLTNVNADADRIRSQIKAADDKVKQLQSIKDAAASVTNYHPEDASPQVRKDAERNAEDYKRRALDEVSKVYGTPMRGGERIVTGRRTPTTEEVDRINKEAEKIKNEHMATHHPQYQAYQDEIMKRLQPQGVGNTMFVFKDDDAKKTLSDFATSAMSQLGTDKGLLSLRIGSGKDAGKDFSASDYDDVQGKIVPLGISNNAKTGETEIIFRGMQDIRGKKTKGENLVMKMKDVGGLDDYIRTHVSPQEYRTFTLDRALKTGLNNVAGSMRYPIRDRTGGVVDDVQITRRQSSTQGPGAFEVRVRTDKGFRVIPADSYNGVIDIIDKLESQHQ